MQTGFSRYSAWPFFILVALQIAAIPMIVPEPEISHHAPFSIVTQVCAFLIWILLIEAWYRLAGLEDCGAMIAVSGGCILLILLVFGPSMPQVWMARFVPLVPYPLRAAAVAIHPVFLHPVVVDRIHEWRMKLTGKGWLLVALVALPVAGWFFRSVQISRDGYECVEFVSQDVWQGELREPLTILLHKVWATWVMWAFPVNAEQALALLSCALGVPAVYLLVRTVRIWAAESGRDAWIPVGMALASGGFLLMWFGHIEVYPVLVAGMIGVCFLAARCLVERKSLIWLMLAYGLLLPFHLSAVWMLPAVIYVAVVAWRRDGVRPVVLAVLALVLVEMLVWGGICVGYYGGSVGAMVRQFWGEMNVGSDKAMFYGMGEMVSFSHLADFVQETLYLSCPAVLGIFVYLGCRSGIRWSPMEVFFGLGALGYAVYVFVWRADRGFPEDYDLFAPFAMLAALFVGMRLSVIEPQARRDRLAYLVIAASLILLAYQFYVHTQLDTHVEYQRHLYQLRKMGLIR